MGASSADGSLSIILIGIISFSLLIHFESSYTSVLFKSPIADNPPLISPYKVQYPSANSVLFPVDKTKEPNLFENAIKIFPLILD